MGFMEYQEATMEDQEAFMEEYYTRKLLLNTSKFYRTTKKTLGNGNTCQEGFMEHQEGF